MKDPYEKVWENIGKSLTKLSNMINWLAKQTLSVKEYMEFVDEFTENKNNDIKSILTELPKDKEDT